MKVSYRVKNWQKFQHFKDRSPIWIKLYRELLDDLEWHKLDGEAAKTLISLWLVASEHNGDLPDTEHLAFRLRVSEKACLSQISKLSHWIEPQCINVISSVYQDDMPEKRREENKLEKRREEVEEAPEKIRASRPKATRWPTDAVVPDDWIADAATYRASLNMPPIDLMLEARRFENYWVEKSGKSGTKIGWKRTWMNWSTSNFTGKANGNSTGNYFTEMLNHIDRVEARRGGDDSADDFIEGTHERA